MTLFCEKHQALVLSHILEKRRCEGSCWSMDPCIIVTLSVKNCKDCPSGAWSWLPQIDVEDEGDYSSKVKEADKIIENNKEFLSSLDWIETWNKKFTSEMFK